MRLDVDEERLTRICKAQGEQSPSPSTRRHAPEGNATRNPYVTYAFPVAATCIDVRKCGSLTPWRGVAQTMMGVARGADVARSFANEPLAHFEPHAGVSTSGASAGPSHAMQVKPCGRGGGMACRPPQRAIYVAGTDISEVFKIFTSYIF